MPDVIEEFVGAGRVAGEVDVQAVAADLGDGEEGD